VITARAAPGQRRQRHVPQSIASQRHRLAETEFLPKTAGEVDDAELVSTVGWF
jgi:hypothetical protein